MVEDVTDRKRAEAELMRYRDHLEELVDQRTDELKSANQRLSARQPSESVPRRPRGRAKNATGFFSNTARMRFCSSERAESQRQTRRWSGCSAMSGLAVGRKVCEISPEFQPDGRAVRRGWAGLMIRSAEIGPPVFEWVYRHRRRCPARLRGERGRIY